eukprot:COSAG01_NODE_617_length_14808_cov_8.352437_2_plen_234_part_00
MASSSVTQQQAPGALGPIDRSADEPCCCQIVAASACRSTARQPAGRQAANLLACAAESMDVDRRPWIDRPQGAAVSLSCRSKSACTRKRQSMRQSKGITAVESLSGITEQAVCKMLMKDMKPAAAMPMQCGRITTSSRPWDGSMQPGEAAAASAMRCHEPHGCPHHAAPHQPAAPQRDDGEFCIRRWTPVAGTRQGAPAGYGTVLVRVLISGQPRPSYRSIVNSHLDMLIQYC